MNRGTLFGTLLVATAGGACGGQIAPPAASVSASGLLDDTPVTFVDAISNSRTQTTGGQTTSSVIVTLTQEQGICGALHDGVVDGTAFTLTLEVLAVDTSVPLGTTGVPANPNGPVTSTVFYTRPGCNEAVQTPATTGTITLNSVGAQSVEGAFDVSFPGGSHAAGTFVAPTCEIPAGTTPTPTCIP